jgi:carbon storage regulator
VNGLAHKVHYHGSIDYRLKCDDAWPPCSWLKEEGVMLVLSRKLGQSFHVGEGVRITVVKIDNNSVRIGIDAPEQVPIQRREITFDHERPLSRENRRG